MAHAIIAPYIDFYGLQLDGIDPIAEDLKQYLNECGVNIIQKNGYISVYGDYKISVEELKKRFPEYYDKYSTKTSTEYTFNGSKPLHFFHVTSNSKATYEEKFWLEKDINSEYSIDQAAADVTRGTLARLIFGEQSFSKIKFDVANRAVVTRTMYSDDKSDNIYDLLDFLEYIVYGKRDLSNEVKLKSALTNLIILSLLTENRSLCVFQMGCEISSANISLFKKGGADKPMVDNLFPFKFWNFPETVTLNENVISFAELIPKIFDDFSIVYDIIAADNLHWNNAKVSNLIDQDMDEAFTVTGAMFAAGMTQDDFNNNFIMIMQDIAKNDFEICSTARENILSDLQGAKSSFSEVEINEHIMPQVDQIIATLKANVQIAFDYYETIGNNATANITSTIRPTP